MVKNLALSALALAALSGCGLFLPDDFPSYLPFVEGVFDLRAEMDSRGYTNFRGYEPIRGWLPRPRHGKDWAFVHVDIRDYGPQRIGVFGLDRLSMNIQGWQENDVTYNQSPYLSETVDGWKTGNTEWKVVSGLFLSSNSNGGIYAYQRNISLGSVNYSYNSFATYNGTTFVYDLQVSSSQWDSNFGSSTSQNPIFTLPRSTPNFVNFIDLLATSDGKTVIMVESEKRGIVGIFPSPDAIYLSPGTSPLPQSYHGFPVVTESDKAYSFITTDGPVVYREGRLIRYAPENGERILDELDLPDGFKPLGFSVDQKQWLGYDSDSGKVYRLRAWWW